MTVFGKSSAPENLAVKIRSDLRMGDTEDYEKIPISPPDEISSASTPTNRNAPKKTLSRLALGCTCISLLLLFIGSISNQPVLVTEGIHSLTDAFCYLIAWIIDSKSKQNIDRQKLLPFGIRRLTVLGGFFIGCFTATSMLFVTLENARQLFEIQDLDSGGPAPYATWAILIGVAELCLNATILILHWHDHDHGHSHEPTGGSRDDANTEGALMHAITDLSTASIVIISSVMQLLVSRRMLIITNLIGCSAIFSVMATVAVKLIKENGRVLLQGTPPDFPLDSLISAVTELHDVRSVIAVRIWQVDDREKLIGSFIVETHSHSKNAAVADAIRDACAKFNVTDAIIECR